VRRYSSLLFALLITANANATAFEQALADYGDKLIECRAIAKNNTTEFPVTDWFSTQDKQNQKNVLLYLSLDNRTRCSAAEKAHLIKTAASAPESANSYL